MANELIQQFQKYMKSGRVEQFREYILQNNLTNEFIHQCFMMTYNRSFEPGSKELDEAMNLSNFALKLSKEIFDQKFGPELSNRFSQIIYETNYPSIRIFDIFRLMQPGIKVNDEYEAAEMFKLMDIVSQPENLVGTHIIGSDIGSSLASEGIVLTGHKWVANDYNDRSSNLKSRLSKNITFFDNDPIGFITQFIQSRGYNNPQGEFNDIMVVSIPREELNRNEPGIIIQNDFGYGLNDCLNPAYIRGFTRVGVRDGHIEGFYDNPAFIDRASQIYGDTVQDWKAKFDGWYEQANMTKWESLKSKVSNFLQGLLNKDKDKQTER